MTDHEKAKDAYSIHQDNLFWSRTQTLIAIQGAVLAGSYALKGRLPLALPLMFLGISLTVILWIIAERDQQHRDEAFRKADLEYTLPDGCRVGGWLIRLVFNSMLFADAYLFLWLLLVRDDVWPKELLHWLGFVFAVSVLLPTIVGMWYIGWKLRGIFGGMLFPKKSD